MFGRFTGVVIGAMCVMMTGAVSAEIYVYRDARGTLQFSNAPVSQKFQPYMDDDGAVRPFAMPRGRYVRLSDPKRRKEFEPMILASARRNRVDPALVKAVIHAESGFVPYARSPKGAMGLMQLMPATARMHGVWQILDPEENVEGGVR